MLSFAKSCNAVKRIIILFFFLVPAFIQGQNTLRKLSINEAVEYGLNNNLEIKNAREKINSVKGKYWSGISLPQPELGLTYEYIPNNNGFDKYGEKTFEVRQSLEFPTNYFLRGNRFNKEEKIAFFELKAKERSLIKQIKLNYYKAIAAQQLLKTAEENLKISMDFYTKAELRYNVGEGTNIEKLTAKVQQSEAKKNLIAAKNGLSSSYEELFYSLGLGKNAEQTPLELIDTLVFHDHKVSIDSLLKQIDESNPEIKIAQLSSEIAGIEKGLAWSSFLPSLSLAYYKQSIDGNERFYGASFGISVPLWFLMEQRGKIQEANANNIISDNELLQKKKEIILRLRAAVLDHENNLNQVKFYIEEILPQSKEIYESARKSYDAGELEYLEYLQAKQMLINSQSNYINAIVNHYQSDFEIEELIGENITTNLELEK